MFLLHNITVDTQKRIFISITIDKQNIEEKKSNNTFYFNRGGIFEIYIYIIFISF